MTMVAVHSKPPLANSKYMFSSTAFYPLLAFLNMQYFSLSKPVFDTCPNYISIIWHIYTSMQHLENTNEYSAALGTHK